ncbi:unnamed protein product [Chondrus crispus]|uniref:Uncharacterized protein n=1 Tax=Chondrus crispus TaxID=2769 RepID=R7Q2Y1_CHOCR|nr:unnamed protein product [Chondrus crispus]CDF32384.1 unnamed protein product [Chondrus crispus]|eukprot:XP_005712049.1 unnamed protein product [Chondrus crispus]
MQASWRRFNSLFTNRKYVTWSDHIPRSKHHMNTGFGCPASPAPAVQVHTTFKKAFTFFKIIQPKPQMTTLYVSMHIGPSTFSTLVFQIDQPDSAEASPLIQLKSPPW